MLANYLPILVFIVVGILLSCVLLFNGYFWSPKKPDKSKLSPYECGFPAQKNARMPFDVRFYLVAILFILFDLETAFLVPWAVDLRALGWFGVLAMLIFFLLLLLGFLYEWKKGGLDWE